MVSIILPIYNIDRYLDRCMKSILSQTYHDIEIIMVDDGSTDACPAKCDEYEKIDKRIKVYHKKNGGLSDARNFGIEKSQGEFVTCIDPDDYVDRDYIEYLVSLVTKYNSKMSICQHRVVFENGRIKELGHEGEEELTPKDCIERMLYHDVIDTSAWAKLYHRSLFKGVKYPKGRIFEDIATTYKLFLKCEKIAVGYKSKYNYIVRKNSIVNDKFNISKLDLLEMTDNMGMDVLGIYPDLKCAVLRRMVYARFSTLNQMLNVDGFLKDKEEMIDFIKSNSRIVFWNTKTPIRDKIAIISLRINYNFYKFLWTHIKR